MVEPECIANVHALLGEGPVWVQRESALYWLDIKGRTVFRLAEGGALTQWPTPMRIGSLAPRKSGGFIAGTEDGIAIIYPDSDRFEIIAKPEELLPDNRFNDGKVDRRGRFWAGSMDDLEQSASGTLYCVTPSGWTAVDRDYKVTNGPAFSPLGDIMYHNDSGRQVTYAFDVDADGKVANRRVFLQFGPGDGYPDGMTVDSEACLWIAFWDGWCLRRYSPEGEWIETVRLPVQRPTSCVFGGHDLDRLYITSARIDLEESALEMQPNAGGLFMLVPGVRGLADVPYDG